MRLFSEALRQAKAEARKERNDKFRLPFDTTPHVIDTIAAAIAGLLAPDGWGWTVFIAILVLYPPQGVPKD